MLPAITPLVALSAPVMLALMEMESIAQVSLIKVVPVGVKVVRIDLIHDIGSFPRKQGFVLLHPNPTCMQAHPLCTNLADSILDSVDALFIILALCLSQCPLPLLFILLLTDVDECELDTNYCHMNATCADVIGSFICTCNNGFEGDGVNCTSKNFLLYL